MYKSFTIFLTLIMLFVFPGCTADVIDTPVYMGKQLVIGVIGEPPEISEDNVNFKIMSFSQLKELQSPTEFDSVFITKEHLSEVANQEYASIIKTSGIPFFFIESKKSHIPFTHEGMSYEEVPDLSADTYATGYYQYDEKFEFWGYGLHNDKIDNASIKDVYSRIFVTIESIASKKN